MIEPDLFRAVPSCPVCGSVERTLTQRRSPKNDDYIAALARELEVPHAEIASVFVLYECADCESVYCDPWLSARASSLLYGKGQAQHLLGWGLFYDWLRGSRKSRTVLAQKEKIWKYLLGVAGPIDVYGELNCPFQGLYPYFNQWVHSREKRQAFRRYLAELKSTSVYPRPSVLARGYRALFAKKSKKEPQAVAKTPQRKSLVGLPRRRYLVWQPSSSFWGANCRSEGTTCQGVAQGMLEAPVIHWEDVERENMRFRVLGLFNCLDHFQEPTELLAQALRCSDYVFIETHKSHPQNTFSRQHLYALGPRFMDQVLPKEASWAALNQEIKDPLQDFYLVSSRFKLPKP